MISGIDLGATIDYVLKDPKEDQSNPTVWKLGIIPSYVYSRIQASENKTDIGFQICQVGIKGWTNAKDLTFKTDKVKFGTYEIDMIPIELIARIPERFLAELAVKIQNMNNLTEEEEKN